jgi:MoxR-like ATPase
MIDCGRIVEAIAGYDPDAQEESILKAEEQRAELIARFPKEAWGEMTLDRYALGQSGHPENFCRWMEFVATELGSIRGGSARKHLIYFQASAQMWWFDRGRYSSIEEAWAAVHRGFLDAIRFAENGEWDQIETITSLHAGPALVNKTLSVYFPDDLLPINSQTHLRHFLRELGEPRTDDQSLGTTRLNRLLLQGLRSCSEVEGWSTKQMERLLYTSHLDPFAALTPTGPIRNVAEFISKMLGDTSDNLDARRQSEDHARKLLDEAAGEMSEEQARTLFRLFNADSNRGRPSANRFSPAFVGQTANWLVSDIDSFNTWTRRIWKGSDEESGQAVDELLGNRKLLLSAGTSYPTMLAYLRNPEKSTIWLRATDLGLQRLTDYTPAKSPGAGGPADYASFCDAAVQLMADYDIPPELLDLVLAEAGRAEDAGAPKPAKPTAGVWLFQANPSIYDIDHALSELDELSWVVRQYKSEIKKGDRVYIWRSGSDAGVLATATVQTDPAELPGDAGDPYLLKPESLSKAELRVVLRIDSVLPEPLRRTDLLEHAVLKDLEVIAFANATNFRVSLEQDEALQSLTSGLQIPTIRPEIEERVYLPRSWLQDAVDLLIEKGQIVFYGPPGTGKTFVALALAEELTRDGGAFRIVQFHPSYSYEDFVGGFRPVEDEGAHGVQYRRTDGPLRQLAVAAAADPRHPYVLVIDEINRGNIPKIFGELLFLLEYRLKAVRLQYWPEEEFSLPPNLFLVGTMNTADRSIALVDAALRRRFYFVEFSPLAEPVRSVLPKWLARNQHGEEAAELLALLNDEIANEEVAIGPSYFMSDLEAGPDLERIWQRAIMPLLEEYFYGTKWDRNRFSLARLQARLHGQDGELPAAEPVEDAGETP